MMKALKKNLKYVLLLRHGEPNNPKNIIYNLDEVMKKEDIIHLTPYGKKQLGALGKVIKKKKFKVVMVRYSNQTRAVESATILNKILKVKDFESEPRLKDVYAPGPYLEKIPISYLEDKQGLSYDIVRWRKYNHESPQSIIGRLDQVFEETIAFLKMGEAAVLFSHGDPLAWFINYKITGRIPDSNKLRDLVYPNQGEAIVMGVNSKGKIARCYQLKDPELLRGKSY